MSATMQENPRIPVTEEESFAMAFMLGYMGWAPDELVECFPEESWQERPDFITPELAHAWRRGYESGLSFYGDHSEPDGE